MCSPRRQKTRVVCSGATVEPNGKSALITGANTGIGFETAKSLAAQGYATVLACRNIEKGRAARDKIKAELPGARVEAVPLDLTDLSTIRSFANKALDGGRPLDVLVNNAGVMATPEIRTKDGFELQLATNHLGHFLLTTMLLPMLTDPSRPSRIVNVSSSAHMFGKINFEDLQSRRSYQPWIAYGQSKLANVLFTYELARRLPLDSNLTVNALHPGVVQTELQRYLVPDPVPWWQVPLLQAASLFLKTPVQGAATSIFLASSPEVEGISSKYWVNCKPVASSKASYDTDVARKLWEVSEELTGADATVRAAQTVG
ncbi:g10167 [Coccomyxa elongata]